MSGTDPVGIIAIVIFVFICAIASLNVYAHIWESKKNVDEAKAQLPEVLPKLPPGVKDKIIRQLNQRKKVHLDPRYDQLLIAVLAGYEDDAGEWGAYFNQAIRKTPKDEVLRMLG